MTAYRFHQLKADRSLISSREEEVEFERQLLGQKRSAAAFRAVNTKRQMYPTWPTRKRDHLTPKETRLTQKDKELLRAIIFESATAIQNGMGEDPDKWQNLADELERAYKLAQIEAGRLAADELAKLLGDPE